MLPPPRGAQPTESTTVVMPQALVESARSSKTPSWWARGPENYCRRSAGPRPARLDGARRRGITSGTINGAKQVPIDASLPAQEQRAQSTIDAARVLGGRQRDRPMGEGPAGEAGRRAGR